MSELRADTITSATDNTDLEIQARGTGVPNLESGFKVNGTVGVPVSALQTGTDGELITWDASGNPATVATGTAAQVLTSNGAGAAPTFQTLSTGSLVLLADTDVSAVSTIDFTAFNNTLYENYLFIFENVKPATDSVRFQMRTSTDGGSTFDSGASDYNYSILVSTSTSTATDNQAGGSSSAIGLTVGNSGNAVNEQLSGHLYLYGPHLSLLTKCTFHTTGADTATNVKNHVGSGYRFANLDVDGIRFFWSSGNFTAQGAIKMYGIAK